MCEATRTMLNFANLPLYYWAKAILRACFTQNHSFIHQRFNSTHEIINKQKPNEIFFSCSLDASVLSRAINEPNEHEQGLFMFVPLR